MDTETAVELFLAAKRAQGLKKLTLEGWNYKLQRFISHSLTLPLKPEKIELFLGNSDWSPGNRDTYYRLLRNCYKFWLSRGHIKVNPMIAVMRPKLPKKRARSFNSEEIQLILNFDYDPKELCTDEGRKLINALLRKGWSKLSLAKYMGVARSTLIHWYYGSTSIPGERVVQLRELNGHEDPPDYRVHHNRNHTTRKYLKPFIYLLADTGVRLGEGLSVTKESFQDGFLEVTGKVGDRIVPVSPLVEDLCLDVLPWPWKNSQQAGKALSRGLAMAGIQGERASAHTFRHTFCRNFEGDESVLVDILGWTSPRMLSVYRPFDRKKASELHRKNSLINQVDSIEPRTTKTKRFRKPTNQNISKYSPGEKRRALDIYRAAKNPPNSGRYHPNSGTRTISAELGIGRSTLDRWDQRMR